MHILIVAPESRKHGDVVEVTDPSGIRDSDSPTSDNSLFVKQISSGGHRFYVADSSTSDKITVDRFTALMGYVDFADLMKCEAH